MSKQWSKICTTLEKTLNSSEYKVWITPLRGNVINNTVHIDVQSAYAANWVKNHYGAALREAVSSTLNIAIHDVELDFRITKPTQRNNSLQTVHSTAQRVHTLPSTSQPMPVTNKQDSAAESTYTRKILNTQHSPKFHTSVEQMTLPIRQQSPLSTVQWRYNFDDFVTGPTNSMAVAAAQEICRVNGQVDTLFVSAASGIGKTHLIHAIGQTLTKEQGHARIGYLTAEEFSSHYRRSSRPGQYAQMDEFKNALRSLDVLLLDDVHFFQGKKGTQEEALATIKSLQSRGSRVVLTSSFTPRELQNVDSQLVSYFCSGYLTTMEKPNLDMRRDILRRKARSYQVLLPDTVTDALIHHLHDDVRQLESCLKNLVFKARQLRSNISIEMAMEMLAQYAKVATHLNMDTIIELVCHSFKLNPTQLASRSRRKEFVLARDTIYYLTRKHTDISLQDIGGRFNRRHTTVIKGIATIERELQKETILGRQVASTVQLVEKNAGIQRHI